MMLEKSDEVLKKITSIKNDFLAKRKKIEVEFFKNKKGLECCKKNSDLTDLLIRKISPCERLESLSWPSFILELIILEIVSLYHYWTSNLVNNCIFL